MFDALVLWFILTAGSLAFVLYDLYTNTPTLGVMKLAWALVVLYTGPIGLFIYFLSCRQPLLGTHETYIAPLWKQGVGSLMHCLSGDATGILIAAIVVFHFGLPNGIDLIIEYITGFVCGLLIFQALFMMPMYNNNYFKAIKKTFFPEFVSMNMLMTGMFPVMIVLMHHIPHGDNPWTLPFWGIMSFAIIIGGITAYPINLWMVKRKIKHGMATPGVAMPGMSHQEHAPPITLAQEIGIILITLTILLFVLWIVSFYAPIRFIP